MKRIAVIGAGGINSHALEWLSKIVNVFDKKEFIYVKIFDTDVVEEKNILRSNQNFKVEDLMEKKAKVLAERYSFDWEDCFILENNLVKLDNFDDIIIGVDNHKTRSILYKYALEKKKYILDMRASGTQRGWYVVLPDDKRKWEYFEEKHFKNKDVMEKKGGCQLQVDIENDHIESGNKIVAYEAMWGIYLKRIRNEEPNSLEFKYAY